jgi:hypothetical protein
MPAVATLVSPTGRRSGAGALTVCGVAFRLSAESPPEPVAVALCLTCPKQQDANRSVITILMLVSDYPMAGRPDARLPWAPGWETLSICCHCVMARDGNGLAVNGESRRNIMNHLDLKKINVCVTNQKLFIAAANSWVGGVIALLLAVSANILARLAGRPPPPELHHPLRRRPQNKKSMTRSGVKRFVALPSAARTAVWFRDSDRGRRVCRRLGYRPAPPGRATMYICPANGRTGSAR